MKKTALALFLMTTLVVFGTSVFQTNPDFSFGPISLKNLFNGSSDDTASIFFKDSVTATSLRKTFDEASKTITKRGWLSDRFQKAHIPEKVKILIVPGHDAEYSGTVFNGLKEVELNLELSEKLYKLLKTEPAFQVFISQTKDGYSPELLKYFEKNQEGILKFIQDQKGKMESFVNAGRLERVVKVKHNFAPNAVAQKLFGINRWANENGIDIIIHIHFNDHPGRRSWQEGKYTGFSIYVPESQYSNSKGSKSVAEAIYQKLGKLYPQSNLPIENEGIVEDQELIAIGSNNTLDGAGLLIEYGYIYESAFQESVLRETVVSDLALQTFLGIMDFFGKDSALELAKLNKNVEPDTFGGKHQTRYVPYQWQEDLERGSGVSEDVLSLQAALALDGVYPPPGKEKNDCGLTGHFGPCTEKSVKAFQEKYEISPAEGFVGEKTREKLNEIYGE